MFGLFRDGPAEVRMSGGLAFVGLSFFELDAPPDIPSFKGFSLSSSSCNRFSWRVLSASDTGHDNRHIR